MRRFLCLLAVLALAVVACTEAPNTPTPINIMINNNQQQGGSPGTTPTPAGVCATVAKVFVAVLGSGGVPSATVKVGESVTLDANAKDASNNPRADACNLKDGISWAASGPCDLEGNTSFTPRVKAKAAGQCTASATVAGVASNTFMLTIQ